MSSDENTYKHYMLPTRTSIRLIKIQQGSTLDAPLSCSFEVVDLLHNPDYVALSYCWGTPAKTTSVKWDGGSLMVSRTVRDILEAFKETASLLWIDALCINQSDIPERNQQVALMADIYSKATAVNVWLGSDQQEDARPVFESIEALFGGLMRLNAFGEEFEESCDHSPRPPSYSSGYLGAEKSELHWETPDGKVTSIALPKTIMQPNEKQKQRLRTFFDLPWFSRSWILQEVGVAAHATLFWGDSSVEWNAVGVSAVFLTRYAKELLKDCGLVEAVENTRQIYFTFSPFTPLTSFFHLMDKIRPFKATDPRDKVFAILSHPSAKRGHNRSRLPRNINAFAPCRNLIMHLLQDVQDVFLLRMMFQNHKAQVASETEQSETFMHDRRRSLSPCRNRTHPLQRVARNPHSSPTRPPLHKAAIPELGPAMELQSRHADPRSIHEPILCRGKSPRDRPS